jgi:two-component system, NtrC family, response regulator
MTDQIPFPVESDFVYGEIFGVTAPMRKIFAVVERVSKTSASVLIEGESGTGKELLARAIHAKSDRRDFPFIPINCGAIPETLLEAELFGYERGAFTGAHERRRGKFELADRGTLFLDEVGEVAPPMQVKLLRFLQEREIERLGGRRRIRIDVRIIAATNRDLRVEMEAGRFRDDLFFRISVVTISVPPLRERSEDLFLLANMFLRKSCETHRRRLRFSPEAVDAIMMYRWPGNVRELQNAVQRAVIMAKGRWIEAPDLAIEAAPATPLSLREARRKVERELIVAAVARNRGNISKAARELRISRSALHELLAKHAISVQQLKANAG